MYYRQPRYFSNFHCVGGDCVDNCCYGWRIDFSKEEVDKLKSAKNASSELKELIEKTFVPNEKYDDKYRVKFDERGKCPLVTENGLCRIQRELGVEYMSDTCMVYPRFHILSNKEVYRFCNMSCREVMKQLLSNDKSMDLVNVSMPKKSVVKHVIKNSTESLQIHPELKYRGELLEFFYEVIADKKHSVEDSMVLGALAAQKLAEIVEKKDFERIPEALKAFRKQFHNAAGLKNIANIKPNYNIKLGVLGEMLKRVDAKANPSALVDDTGMFNIDFYRQGEQRLEETYKDRPFAFRNIALNLLLEMALPFKFEDKTIFENYSLFVTLFGLFKLNAIAISEFTKNTESNQKITASNNSNITLSFNVKLDTDSFVCNSCAFISRSLCHSSENGRALIDVLKAYKMTSPAYLALLVK